MNFMKTVAMNPARMNRTGYVPSARSSTRSDKGTIVHRPTNPMTLICPLCGAKPGQVCMVLEGQMEVIHSARIEAAAAHSHSDSDVGPVGGRRESGGPGLRLMK